MLESWAVFVLVGFVGFERVACASHEFSVADWEILAMRVSSAFGLAEGAILRTTSRTGADTRLGAFYIKISDQDLFNLLNLFSP